MVKHRDKIREFVEYLLDTDDVEVINHYDDMLWEIVEEISREIAKKAFNAGQFQEKHKKHSYMMHMTFNQWWKYNQEDK